MRALLALSLLLVPVLASARPRAQVSPFTVSRGDESLAYLGPEIARAVTLALEAAGVNVGAGGELAVTGRIDELASERMRLTASVRGRSVVADGPLESIDELASELGTRLAPLLLEDSHARGRKDPAATKEGVTKEKERAASSEPPSPPRIASAAAKALALSDDRDADPASLAKQMAQDASSRRDAPSPEAAGVSASSTGGASKPAISAAPAGATRPAADDDEEPATRTPTHEPPPPYGYTRGRVVAHAVAETPHAFVGSGVSATQALYYFLRLRLHLAVVPVGVGMVSPHIAADEAWRSGARAVVMARLAQVEYLPAAAGPSVRVRLEVAVVRDGRVILRRAIQSAPTDAGPVGLRRSRQDPSMVDPVFQAVTQSLDAILPDLTAVLVER